MGYVHLVFLGKTLEVRACRTSFEQGKVRVAVKMLFHGLISGFKEASKLATPFSLFKGPRAH